MIGVLIKLKTIIFITFHELSLVSVLYFSIKGFLISASEHHRREIHATFKREISFTTLTFDESDVRSNYCPRIFSDVLTARAGDALSRKLGMAGGYVAAAAAAAG